MKMDNPTAHRDDLKPIGVYTGRRSTHYTFLDRLTTTGGLPVVQWDTEAANDENSKN